MRREEVSGAISFIAYDMPGNRCPDQPGAQVPHSIGQVPSGLRMLKQSPRRVARLGFLLDRLGLDGSCDRKRQPVRSVRLGRHLCAGRGFHCEVGPLCSDRDGDLVASGEVNALASGDDRPESGTEVRRRRGGRGLEGRALRSVPASPCQSRMPISLRLPRLVRARTLARRRCRAGMRCCSSRRCAMGRPGS